MEKAAPKTQLALASANSNELRKQDRSRLESVEVSRARIECYEVSRFKPYSQTIRHIAPHHHQRPIADVVAVAFAVYLFFSNRQRNRHFDRSCSRFT
jgi:hypothetical protein